MIPLDRAITLDRVRLSIVIKSLYIGLLRFGCNFEYKELLPAANHPRAPNYRRPIIFWR